MKIVPLELRELNALVERLHRHHRKVQGHRFSIGAEHDGNIVGGASIGRPVNRSQSPKEVLEVTRLVTDGTPNACSFLYSAAARIGKAMGYKRIQTYILESEPGISLRAAGWEMDRLTEGSHWHTGGRQRDQDQPQGKKQRWFKYLAP